MLVPGSVFSLLLLAAVCAASHFFSRAPALVAEQLGDEGGVLALDPMAAPC